MAARVTWASTRAMAARVTWASTRAMAARAACLLYLPFPKAGQVDPFLPQAWNIFFKQPKLTHTIILA